MTTELVVVCMVMLLFNLMSAIFLDKRLEELYTDLLENDEEIKEVKKKEGEKL